jgi:hypothetical protein
MITPRQALVYDSSHQYLGRPIAWSLRAERSNLHPPLKGIASAKERPRNDSVKGLGSSLVLLHTGLNDRDSMSGQDLVWHGSNEPQMMMAWSWAGIDRLKSDNTRQNSVDLGETENQAAISSSPTGRAKKKDPKGDLANPLGVLSVSSTVRTPIYPLRPFSHYAGTSASRRRGTKNVLT